jgi:hypothetical protein
LRFAEVAGETHHRAGERLEAQLQGSPAQNHERRRAGLPRHDVARLLQAARFGDSCAGTPQRDRDAGERGL